MKDIRDDIFKMIKDKTIDAVIVADGEGVIAGTDKAGCEAGRLGLTVKKLLAEGSLVKPGDIIGHFEGCVKEIIMRGLSYRLYWKAVGHRHRRPPICTGIWRSAEDRQRGLEKDAVRNKGVHSKCRAGRRRLYQDLRRTFHISG